MQKAAVNAIVSTGLYKDPDRFQELYMDNQYSAPELVVMLKTKYKSLACCTITTNRKGSDWKVMNFSNSSTRGESKTYYDPINGVLFGKWNNNKVVLIYPVLSNGIIDYEKWV